MKKLSYFLIVSFIVIGCSKEENPAAIEQLFLGNDNTTNVQITPEIYSGVPASARTNLINETFDSNNNTFEIVSNANKQSKIENGYYTCENYTSNYVTKFSSLQSLSTDRNYEVEFLFNVSYGGFYWGAIEESQNQYHYWFINMGELQSTLGYYSSSWHYWYQDEACNSLIANSASFNKLTLRKYNNKYYLFINEVVFKQFDVSLTYGSKFGFLLNPYATASVDYIKIDYFN